MTIDRRFDDQAQAWEYADAEVSNAALLWILDHDFNLAAFDDWVEDPATTPARREQLLSMRQQAIDAQHRGDDAAAAGWVQTMRLTQQMSRRMGALLPLAAKQASRAEREETNRARGADATRVYSEDDRDRWRELFADRFRRHSRRRAARLILKEEGLPEQAFETVRRALGKETGQAS
ncbi:MAG: hypothetical protein IPO59_11335 [Betaproteobacteria bacterium]|nr:hypothetical protein [Betaproteobacteria bacterium]